MQDGDPPEQDDPPKVSGRALELEMGLTRRSGSARPQLNCLKARSRR